MSEFRATNGDTMKRLRSEREAACEGIRRLQPAVRKAREALKIEEDALGMYQARLSNINCRINSLNFQQDEKRRRAKRCR